MSRKYLPAQFAGPKGGFMGSPKSSSPFTDIFGFKAGVPTNAQSGWELMAQNWDLTNGAVYYNTGTTTSATWTRFDPTAATITTLTATNLAVTNAPALPAGTTIGGVPLDAASQTVVVAPATTTLTLTAALHAGRILNIASTGGLAITPPAATGTFNIYRFLVTATITGGSFTVDPKAGNASDIANATALQTKVGTSTLNYGSVANTNLITLNGTTTGGIKGDYLQMIDVATNMWHVLLIGQATGSVATPFSNH